MKDSPGADDNAAAVAVLLAVARAVQREGLGPVPVMVAALDMEETGHFGARALARELAGQQMASAMVCMDMVGFYSDAEGSQKMRRVMYGRMHPDAEVDEIRSTGVGISSWPSIGATARRWPRTS